jgi:hypothetical protein
VAFAEASSSAVDRDEHAMVRELQRDAAANAA